MNLAIKSIIVLIFLTLIPKTSSSYYHLSNSKVVGETILGTYTKEIFVGKDAALKLSDIPGWYPADNTNPNSVEMDLLQGNYVLFTGLKEGFSAGRVCNDFTTQCITILITVLPETSNTSKFKNGDLILEGTTVYIIYKNTKTPFTNYPAFINLGFNLKQISYIGDASNIPNSGYKIENGNEWHPWGSFVKQNKQIYFVHELGLMPIPSMEVFIQNNGNIKMVVNINKADITLDKITPMIINDTRLK